MSQPTRPSDNPFNAQCVDKLRYIPFDHTLEDVAQRLKNQRYRGAICGPHGCGKSAMLHALGDQLMEHGLSPLPLFINNDQQGRLPTNWSRTIRHARPGDVLLLDGYDLLSKWARMWVVTASHKVGGVVVTTHRPVYFKTVARPGTSPLLLRQLIKQLAPSTYDQIDADLLYQQAQGNLRDALRLAYDQYAAQHGSL